MSKPEWLQQRERQELVARKNVDASTEDPEFTQCVIAYINWRTDGAQGSFDLFKRDWYARRPKPGDA
jgi:hypothetical protein